MAEGGGRQLAACPTAGVTVTVKYTDGPCTVDKSARSAFFARPQVRLQLVGQMTGAPCEQVGPWQPTLGTLPRQLPGSCPCRLACCWHAWRRPHISHELCV